MKTREKRTKGEKYPVVSDCPEQQAHYVRMRRNGETHRFAEMVALRAAPACNTDDTFLKGGFNGSQFAKNPDMGEIRAKELRKRGGSTAGKRYVAGLARYVGDPEAWVSSKSEAKAVLKKRGWGSEALGVKMTADLEPPKPIGVAPDLVKKKVKQMAAVDPDCVRTPKKREETYQKARDAIKPHWVKD